MGRKYSFEKVVYFTKCTVYFVCTWPPPRTATKWEVMKYDIVWFISIVSALCFCVPVTYSIYVYWHDSLTVTQSTAFLFAITNDLIKTFVYRIYRKRTQTLIEEMEDSLKNLLPHERIVIQRYVDRCSAFHTFITGASYMGAFFMFLTPLIHSDRTLPVNAIYPFNVESGIPMYLVYIHQTISGLQCAAGITIDCQTALIMWFAGARLEILAEELADASGQVSGLQHFVKKHKKLISYALEISDTASYIAFASTTTGGAVAILCSLQLLGVCNPVGETRNPPLAVRIEFGLGITVSTLNLLINAWPADNLIHVCDMLANAVYNTSWIDMSPIMMKNWLVILQRCQRPIIVSIGGFVPSLSLRSYASFVSGLFSYFTALRAVMSSEN